jgi:SAM-dependent methyltransferase
VFPDPAAFWNQRYEQPGYLFGTEPNAYLAAQLGLLVPGWRALSVADGEGRNSVWLAQHGLEVDAVEISPVAVDKARALAAERGVAPRFHVASVLDWDFGVARYDLVAAIFIQFLAPAERAGVFRRLAAALAPGGWLVMQGYTPQQVQYGTGGPPHAENMYTEPLLREAFADLEMVELRAYEAHVAEGSGHLGWSALIDLLARKPAAADGRLQITLPDGEGAERNGGGEHQHQPLEIVTRQVAVEVQDQNGDRDDVVEDEQHRGSPGFPVR